MARGASKRAAVRSQAGLIEPDTETKAISAVHKFVSELDNEVDAHQPRGGIQSISRAFLILEEIAYTRKGIALSRAEQARRPAQQHSFSYS